MEGCPSKKVVFGPTGELLTDLLSGENGTSLIATGGTGWCGVAASGGNAGICGSAGRIV